MKHLKIIIFDQSELVPWAHVVEFSKQYVNAIHDVNFMHRNISDYDIGDAEIFTNFQIQYACNYILKYKLLSIISSATQ